MNQFTISSKRLPSDFAQSVIDLEMLTDEKFKDDLKIETVQKLLQKYAVSSNYISIYTFSKQWSTTMGLTTTSTNTIRTDCKT